MKTKLSILGLASLALALGGCGDGASATPWANETATVRGIDGSVDELAWGDGDCLELESGECVDPEQECGGKGAADIYVDEEGQVLEVICYPPGGDDNEVVTLSGGDEPPEIGNGDIVVIEGDADAPAQSGDLEIEENNLTIWGDDPARSVIDGNFTVNGNNWLISGVTVTGNLIVNFNDTQITNCVIEGNVILEGNNTKLAGCRVDGNIEVSGNGSSLVNNDVDGSIEDDGQNTECEGNYRGSVDEAVACE